MYERLDQRKPPISPATDTQHGNEVATGRVLTAAICMKEEEEGETSNIPFFSFWGEEGWSEQGLTQGPATLEREEFRHGIGSRFPVHLNGFFTFS